MLLTEVKPSSDRNLYHLITRVITRSRMTAAITFSRQNDAIQC